MMKIDINVDNIYFNAFMNIISEYNKNNDNDNMIWKCVGANNEPLTDGYNFIVTLNTKEKAVEFKMRYI